MFDIFAQHFIPLLELDYITSNFASVMMLQYSKFKHDADVLVQYMYFTSSLRARGNGTSCANSTF